jgi:hypothetical protein
MYGADAAVPQAIMINLPVSFTETLVGSLSSLIDETRIRELPLAGRDVYTLLVLQPGVTSDNAAGRGLGFAVHGQRAGNSNFLLDGVDNNDLLVTGPAARVSAEAVQEYRLNTSNFTAEFGRASGFIANAITRSGTNQLHGTLFDYFNHDRLNANSFSYNWQDVSRPPFRQNQYGGVLGGPPAARPALLFRELRTVPLVGPEPAALGGSARPGSVFPAPVLPGEQPGQVAVEQERPAERRSDPGFPALRAQELRRSGG